MKTKTRQLRYSFSACRILWYSLIESVIWHTYNEDTWASVGSQQSLKLSRTLSQLPSVQHHGIISRWSDNHQHSIMETSADGQRIISIASWIISRCSDNHQHSIMETSKHGKTIIRTCSKEPAAHHRVTITSKPISTYG